MGSASQNGNKSQNGGLIDGWCVNGDDVGTGIEFSLQATGSVGHWVDRVVHLKATRRTAAYLGGILGEWELNAISIVNLWCDINRREGGSEKVIVNWSGYTRRWKAKMYSGIRGSVGIGALEYIKFGRGFQLSLTMKGHRILDIYEKMFDQVDLDMGTAKYKQELKRKERQDKAELIRSIRKAA